MHFASARQTVVRQMERVGFQLVESTEENPNPLIHDEHDFEVWVYYNNDGIEGKEALYFEMTIEDDGRVSLYWWDFTHTTFVCRLDRGAKGMFHGLQKLFCGELTPPIAA